MKNYYSNEDCQKYIENYSDQPKDLAIRVYTSHLLGRESDLVLHGGGNTSVKTTVKNILGENMDVLYIKGSGWDLLSIEPEGFPALDLEYLKKLRSVDSLSDEEMVNQMRTHMLNSSSPDPSVEALLHAFLPFKFIDHTHADSIVTLTNQKDNIRIIKEALGDNVAILEYIMPGFPLSKAVDDLFSKNPNAEAIVLLNHGLFTFANDAKTSYENTIKYVNMAEKYIEKNINDKVLLTKKANAKTIINKPERIADICQLIRGALTNHCKNNPPAKFILELRNPSDIAEASISAEASEFCVSGLLTPDHVIRTKANYLYIDGLSDDVDTNKAKINLLVESYMDDYNKYFKSCMNAKGAVKKQLDPLPRVFFVEGIGIIAAGLTKKDAVIAADIAEHTIRAKINAKGIGEYISISDSLTFDMEYWVLEQKKLGKAAKLPLQGQVAFVSGGGGAMATGIGDRLLAAGAVLVLSDINEERMEKVKQLLSTKYKSAVIKTVKVDVTNYEEVENAFNNISRSFGGIDIVVPNAGIAHVAKIEDLNTESLDKVMDVNFFGVFNLIKAASKIFKTQGTGGNIIVNSSKNVFDPSPSFSAYSASKSAAHQLSKIAAMEFAEIGARVNMINADAVFGDNNVSSGLWDTIGSDRMKARGLDPEGLKKYYVDRNLLKTQVLAEHVGNAVVFFATEQTPTTGATLPVDGGIANAFPR